MRNKPPRGEFLFACGVLALLPTLLVGEKGGEKNIQANFEATRLILSTTSASRGKRSAQRWGHVKGLLQDSLDTRAARDTKDEMPEGIDDSSKEEIQASSSDQSVSDPRLLIKETSLLELTRRIASSSAHQNSSSSKGGRAKAEDFKAKAQHITAGKRKREEQIRRNLKEEYLMDTKQDSWTARRIHYWAKYAREPDGTPHLGNDVITASFRTEPDACEILFQSPGATVVSDAPQELINGDSPDACKQVKPTVSSTGKYIDCRNKVVQFHTNIMNDGGNQTSNIWFTRCGAPKGALGGGMNPTVPSCLPPYDPGVTGVRNFDTLKQILGQQTEHELQMKLQSAFYVDAVNSRQKAVNDESTDEQYEERPPCRLLACPKGTSRWDYVPGSSLFRTAGMHHFGEATESCGDVRDPTKCNLSYYPFEITRQNKRLKNNKGEIYQKCIWVEETGSCKYVETKSFKQIAGTDTNPGGYSYSYLEKDAACWHVTA